MGIFGNLKYLCVGTSKTLPMVRYMPMMMFLLDLVFISVITVKVVVFISVFDMGSMPMIISIMNANYLIKKKKHYYKYYTEFVHLGLYET